MRCLMMSVMVVLAAVVAGCAADRPDVAAPSGVPMSVDRDRPPADLSITVTVFYVDGDPADTRGVERARFLIEPGGQLRAATGPAVELDLFPPRTRRLTDPQVLDVYGRIVRGGLAAGADSEAGPGSFRLDPDRSLLVLEMVAHERQTFAVHPLADSPAAADLADRLLSIARVR